MSIIVFIWYLNIWYLYALCHELLESKGDVGRTSENDNRDMHLLCTVFPGSPGNTLHHLSIVGLVATD